LAAATKGFMECVGQAAHEAGARTIGVVPRVIEKGGRVFARAWR
jgi:predicted Rossmann-fold nucleotide-binding protein